MNPYKFFSEEERELISHVNKIENREYSNTEIRLIESNILEDIFLKSSKNGDIQKESEEYRNILDKLQKVITN